MENTKQLYAFQSYLNKIKLYVRFVPSLNTNSALSRRFWLSLPRPRHSATRRHLRSPIAQLANARGRQPDNRLPEQSVSTSMNTETRPRAAAVTARAVPVRMAAMADCRCRHCACRRRAGPRARDPDPRAAAARRVSRDHRHKAQKNFTNTPLRSTI